MNVYIALLRGINVGGSNRLPMKDLTQLFERCGCAEVQTYIQSGNVVFRSTDANAGQLANRVTAAIAKARGFAPRLLVLSRTELERAAAGNPFPEADGDPQRVHLFFLVEAARAANLNAMNAPGSSLPWELTFSYGRALQDSALKAWAGQSANVSAAQRAFLHRARCNAAARSGKWTPALESSSES